ncbi:MAG: beta-phosphoglucomutase, partial [Lachnospiraceae bacterium]|nr:beta-phosphoglucomutase [Lachnospiraceae bacterium]
VLVFTDKYHFLAWKKIADELDIPFDEKDNDRLRGVGRAESLDIILEKYTGEELSSEKKAELLERKNDIYKEQLKNMSPSDVTDDVRNTLKKLHERGYLLSVGSSSKNTAYILERTDLGKYFDAVADGTHITRTKPDPEVFLKAAEFLKVEPEDCLVIEDADAGIEAAIAAGMHSAAIGPARQRGRAEACIGKISDILSL